MNLGLHVAAGAAYFALAIASAMLFRRERSLPETRGTSLIWIAFSGLLVLLSFLTLTNIGNDLVEDVRQIARREGWYAVRRPLQAQVVIACALFVTLGYVWSLVRLGNRIGRYALVLTAFAWLVGFTTVRSISLHQIDAVMGMRIGPVRIGFLGNAVGVGLAVTALAFGFRRLPVEEPEGG